MNGDIYDEVGGGMLAGDIEEEDPGAMSWPRRSYEQEEGMSNEGIRNTEHLPVYDEPPPLDKEKAMLLLLLDKKDKELAEARRLHTRVSASDRTDASSPSQTRIAELVKKNRIIRVALEKERSRALKAEADAMHVRKELEATREASDRVGIPERDQEVKEGNERLLQISARLTEVELANVQLRKELTRAHRALMREVGEDVPLDKILDEKSDWRGRAQKIVLLKARMKDMQRASAERASRPSSATSSSLPVPLPVSKSFDDIHREDLEQKSRERRRQWDGLTHELEAKSTELDAIQKRFEGSQIRIKLLEKECRKLRERVQILTEKSENDDIQLKSLQNELEKTERAAEQWRGKCERLEENRRRAVEFKRVVEEQEKQLDHQEDIILSLNTCVKKLTNEAQEYANTPQLKYDLRMAQIEAEKAKELVKVMEQRLKDTSQAYEELVLQRSRCRASVAPSEGPRQPSRSVSREKFEGIVHKLQRRDDEVLQLREHFRLELARWEAELDLVKSTLREEQLAHRGIVEELQRSPMGRGENRQEGGDSHTSQGVK